MSERYRNFMQLYDYGIPLHDQVDGRIRQHTRVNRNISPPRHCRLRAPWKFDQAVNAERVKRAVLQHFIGKFTLLLHPSFDHHLL